MLFPDPSIVELLRRFIRGVRMADESRRTVRRWNDESGFLLPAGIWLPVRNFAVLGMQVDEDAGGEAAMPEYSAMEVHIGVDDMTRVRVGSCPPSGYETLRPCASSRKVFHLPGPGDSTCWVVGFARSWDYGCFVGQVRPAHWVRPCVGKMLGRCLSATIFRA